MKSNVHSLFWHELQDREKVNACSRAKKHQKKSIMTLFPRMFEPKLTVPTFSGWILVSLILWMAPLVYGFMLIKSCLRWDIWWVHLIWSAQNCWKPVDGEAIICTEASLNLNFSCSLGAGFCHWDRLLFLLNQSFFLLTCLLIFG